MPVNHDELPNLKTKKKRAQRKRQKVRMSARLRIVTAERDALRARIEAYTRDGLARSEDS